MSLPIKQTGDKLKPENWRVMYLLSHNGNSFQSISNEVRSANYTLWNLLPKNIFTQFCDIWYFWFLFISILQLSLSTSSVGTSAVIIPFIVLLFITLISDAYHDLPKHRHDQTVNNKEYLVCDGFNFVLKKSKDIKIGDVIQIREKETCPADILMLCVKGGESEIFVDMSGVNGEPTFESKKPIKETMEFTSEANEFEAITLISRINAIIKVPENRISGEFKGSIRLESNPKSSVISSLNYIKRGAKPIDAQWILGLVIYAGEDTPYKQKLTERLSASKKRLNKVVLIMMIFAGVFVLLTVVNTIENHHYSDNEGNLNFILSVIVLYSYLVPISLFIALRVTKLIISFSLRKSYNIRINDLSAIEDGGQIEYILADKTGTITNGNFQLQVCIVAGDIYMKDDFEFCQSPYEFLTSPKTEARAPLIIHDLVKHNSKTFKTFHDLRSDFALVGPNSVFYHFTLCMAICNSTYMRADRAISPISIEEKVMIETSKELGIKLRKKTSQIYDAIIFDEELKLKVIGYQRKSHNAKKSRIIVKNTITGHTFLYVSGSREPMMKHFYYSSEDSAYIEELISRSEMVDKKVIIFGYKELSKEEVEKFEVDYLNFKLLPVISEGKIEDLFIKLEDEVRFLGAVGLEETVLEETKEAIASLTQAGIKIWVLSGDNEENTLCTGIASGLFKPGANISKISNITSPWDCTVELLDQIKTNLFHVNTNTYITPVLGRENSSFEKSGNRSPHHVQSNFEMLYQNSIQHPQGFTPSNAAFRVRRKSKMRRRSVNPVLISNLSKGSKLRSPLSDTIIPESIHFVLSIDRSIVEFGLKSEENRKYLAALLCAADSVCFHSLLPDDKTKITRFLRYRFSYDPIILAIGDETSDIGMIKHANIGVGIIKAKTEHIGKAAIRKFSQLRELILYQGHTKFLILSKVLMLSFFMNYLITFVLLFYCNSSFTSCQSMLDEDFIVFYLFLLVFVPIVGSGLFDEDLTKEQVYKYPQVYNARNHLAVIKPWKFLASMGTAFIYAMIIYFPVYSVYIMNDKGFTLDLYTMEIIIYLSLYIMSMLYIIIQTTAFNIWTGLAYLVSLVALIIFLNVEHNDPDDEHYGVLDILYESPLLWCYIIILPVICICISLAFKLYMILLHPSLSYLIKVKGKKLLNINISSRLEEFKSKMESIYKKSNSLKHDHDSFEINPWTLKFSSKLIENEFQIYSSHNVNNYRIFLGISYFSFAALGIYEICTSETTESYGIFIIVTFTLYAILLISSLTSIFNTYHKEMSILAAVFNIVISIVNIFIFSIQPTQLYLYWSPLFLFAESGLWMEMGIITIITFIICGMCSIYFNGRTDWDTSNKLVYFLEILTLYMAMSLIVAARLYVASKSKRNRWKFLKNVDNEMEKSEQVLNFVLPAFVRKRVKDGIRYIAEDQGVVSVLFCDIDNFDEILSNYPSSEITQFLDEIYRKFDNICDTTGVTKIETVGNVYMACAGLKDSEMELPSYFRSISHSRRCIEMGLKILSTVDKIYLNKGESLKVKIGIHTGPVTAGVVGYHKPQFSLVGDTVNTASRMASTLNDPLMIQISEDTYSHLDDLSGLSFTKRTVSVKGKGNMNTVLVSFNQSSDISLKDMEPLLPTLQYGNNSSMIRANFRSTMRLDSVAFNNHSAKSSTVFTDRRSSDLSNSNIKLPTQDFSIWELCPFNTSETHQDRMVRHQMLDNYSNALFFGTLVGFFCNFIMMATNLATMITEDQNAYSIADFCFYITKTILFGLILLTIRRFYRKKYFSIMLEATYTMSIIAKLIIGFYQTEISEELSTEAYLFLMYFILLQCTGLFFKNIFVVSLLVVIFWIISLFFSGHEFPVEEAIIVFGFTSVVQFVTFYRERNLRIFLDIENTSHKELEKIEALLTQMMPPHVFQNLREEIAITDSFNNVTVLYADIAGFTAWSSNKEAIEVVGMLSNFFTRFDKLCVEHNVYKVHTIGDCYVAMGLNGTDFERNPSQECLNIINFAHALLETIEIVNADSFLSLKMRIGIHTGSIIGGIAGATIIRYDIFGSDVIIANKMESNGVPGSICVSEDTMTIIESYKPGMFKFNRHQDVQIPTADRTIKTYLLEKDENVV
ncbi:unnamed protein product [Blepharisma stoltei]|uniref:Guanylate cyclase domain-containing protein n=1 Tax=Blepharisma stoltei TaxID=1481888 RepID=A0AAU9ICF5_9CILI|nr:unnamed protein product [Blepharisma stoltei]